MQNALEMCAQVKPALCHIMLFACAERCKNSTGYLMAARASGQMAVTQYEGADILRRQQKQSRPLGT